MMATTATYIGLRTKRYRPVTTRFRVGAIGAGVPSPCSAKRANESTSPGTPARINITPMTRVNSRPKNGGRSSQRVIDHWMSSANVQGATTKKKAEPRMAIVFCTAAPQHSGMVRPQLTDYRCAIHSGHRRGQISELACGIEALPGYRELRHRGDLWPGDLPTPPAF